MVTLEFVRDELLCGIRILEVHDQKYEDVRCYENDWIIIILLLVK